MAGFIDRLLSGKYPQIEKLWLSQFDRIVEEIFSSISMDDLDEAQAAKSDAGKLRDATDHIDSQDVLITALRADLDRLETVLTEERSRLESARREISVLKAERAALVYKLEAAQKELRT